MTKNSGTKLGNVPYMMRVHVCDPELSDLLLLWYYYLIHKAPESSSCFKFYMYSKFYV